jgi:hypothetical protein
LAGYGVPPPMAISGLLPWASAPCSRVSPSNGIGSCSRESRAID